jgi:hypothetical protein
MVAARLESVRGDGACWIRAVLLEACGRFEEAAAALHLLREKTEVNARPESKPDRCRSALKGA